MMLNQDSSVKKEESVEELEQRKLFLLADITVLGKQKEILDELVSNHDANNTKYTTLVNLNTELEGSISSKEKLIEMMNTNIQTLSNTITELESKISEHTLTLEDKQSLKTEVEKYQGMIRILQKEMADFQVQHANNKQFAETELKKTKEQLHLLHTAVSSVVLQLK